MMVCLLCVVECGDPQTVGGPARGRARARTRYVTPLFYEIPIYFIIPLFFIIPIYFMITKHSPYYNNPSGLVATNDRVLNLRNKSSSMRQACAPPPWLCLICLLLCDVIWQAERQMESMEEDAIAALTLMSGVGKGEVRASSHLMSHVVDPNIKCPTCITCTYLHPSLQSSSHAAL